MGSRYARYRSAVHRVCDGSRRPSRREAKNEWVNMQTGVGQHVAHCGIEVRLPWPPTPTSVRCTQRWTITGDHGDIFAPCLGCIASSIKARSLWLLLPRHPPDRRPAYCMAAPKQRDSHASRRRSAQGKCSIAHNAQHKLPVSLGSRCSKTDMGTPTQRLNNT